MASSHGRFAWISITAHVSVGAAIVLLPILSPAELPPAQVTRVRLLDPAPPPPPPLAWGSPEAKRSHRPLTRETSRPQAALTAAQEPVADEQAGSLDGTLDGSEDGVIDGVDGGVAGWRS